MQSTAKDAMKQTLVAIAIVFVFALPARAEQRCYQTTAPSQPPHAATFTPTLTSCSTTPVGACWYRVTAWRIDPPPYDLWLAAPSSWNFEQCQFFDYWGPNASGDPIIRWLLGTSACTPMSCNTQPPLSTRTPDGLKVPQFLGPEPEATQGAAARIRCSGGQRHGAGRRRSCALRDSGLAVLVGETDGPVGAPPSPAL